MDWTRPPVFTNKAGVKWWHYKDVERDIRREQGCSRLTVFCTENSAGERDYVAVVDNAVVVAEPYSLGVEQFIAKCVVYGFRETAISENDSDDPAVETYREVASDVQSYTINADVLCRILNLNGFQGVPKDSEEANNRLGAVAAMTEKTKTQIIELMCDRMPLHLLPGHFFTQLADNVCKEWFNVEDKRFRYLHALNSIAELVLPPGTYADVHEDPTKVVKAVREIREAYFNSLNTIEVEKGIEHEEH